MNEDKVAPIASSFVVGIIFGAILGVVLDHHLYTYGRSALIEKGILEYHKNTGELLWAPQYRTETNDHD